MLILVWTEKGHIILGCVYHWRLGELKCLHIPFYSLVHFCSEKKKGKEAINTSNDKRNMFVWAKKAYNSWCLYNRSGFPGNIHQAEPSRKLDCKVGNYIKQANIIKDEKIKTNCTCLEFVTSPFILRGITLRSIFAELCSSKLIWSSDMVTGDTL